MQLETQSPKEIQLNTLIRARCEPLAQPAQHAVSPLNTRVRLRTVLCTGFALAAFAGNSLFCRLALRDGAIDAASFSTIRLMAGAALLFVVAVLFSREGALPTRKNLGSAVWLFAYATAFSFAYLDLSAGTGALILFAAVQCTMIASALRSGERPHPFEWAGLVIALGGLVYLVLPGIEAPDPVGAALMTGAGIAWGLYSVRGRGETDARAATTRNFILAVPPACVVSLVAMPDTHLTAEGVLLAVLSGAVASGAGYVAWYAALKGLSATRAATVQLPVPVLTALGGVLFLSEVLSTRLVLSAIVVLGGVGLAMAGKSRNDAPSCNEVEPK